VSPDQHVTPADFPGSFGIAYCLLNLILAPAPGEKKHGIWREACHFQLAQPNFNASCQHPCVAFQHYPRLLPLLSVQGPSKNLGVSDEKDCTRVIGADTSWSRRL
jgi:hypothetical protein